MLKRFAAFLPAGGSLLVGPGDDCAVVRVEDTAHDLLLKTDCVVEGVHFEPSTPPEKVGRKALARALSDIAAMGGQADHALVTLVLPAATASIANAGPHGLTEMLYAYSSATGNNGSAFGGLAADTPWMDLTLGIAMMLGRFAYVVPVMAIAGSLAAKVKVPPSSGTFPTDGPLFVGLLIGIILILGGLQFFPALALGPIVEHLAMLAGQTF